MMGNRIIKKRQLFNVLWALVFVYGELLPHCVFAEEQHSEENHHYSYHKAHHGGVLNVIGKCEIGHIEVRLEGDILEAWFVGGARDTNRSVPIQARSITLVVKAPGKENRTLVLKADPMKLAGETHGHCSRFVARAEWLKDVQQFETRGEVVFKGVRRRLFIRYPDGYDPDHRHE